MIGSGFLDAATARVCRLRWFACLCQVWATFVIERWKRKSSEIAYVWNMSDFIRTQVPVPVTWLGQHRRSFARLDLSCADKQ